jgi:hypothetical protein
MAQSHLPERGLLPKLPVPIIADYLRQIPLMAKNLHHDLLKSKIQLPRMSCRLIRRRMAIKVRTRMKIVKTLYFER